MGAILLPGVHGDAGPAAVHGVATCEEEDGLPSVPCELYAEAFLTMGACDADRCAYHVDTASHVVAHLPNLLWMETTVHDGGSACFGPPPVWTDAVAWPDQPACGRVCESWRFGRASSCLGGTDEDASMALAPGACAPLFVVSYMTWGYSAQNAGIIFRYDVCRLADDAFRVSGDVWYATGQA